GFCGQALDEAVGDDARCSRILAYRSWVHLFSGEAREALSDGRMALEMAEEVGDPVLLATAIAQVGRAEGWSAESTQGLLERGLEIEEGLGAALEYDASPRIAFGRTLIRLGQLDQARTVLEEADASAAGRGDERTRNLVLGRLSTLEWYAGDLERAL